MPVEDRTLMSSLFIAPEGAMQFEITHPETQYRGEHFWVIPAHGLSGLAYENWPCTCGLRRYIVLMDSLSPRMKACGPMMDGYVVCECVGHIIE